MFKLNDLSGATLGWYYEQIKNKINLSVLSHVSKVFLNEETLKNLLIGKPEILLDIHNAAPCELRDKLKVQKSFHYKSLISDKKTFSYELSRRIGINTCTYCNRNYTLTIGESSDISRPQFDHFFSQQDYPLLALSIYNLIPSCSICNSAIKGAKKLDIRSNLHPYIIEKDKNENDFVFSYELNCVDELSVKIKCQDGSKIRNTIDFFKLEEMYDAHSSFELKDLYDLRVKYPDIFFKIIDENFEGLISKSESYRMIFGIEYNEDSYNSRPFSKFKNDIIAELLKKK